jgi:hypothetical protein
LQTVAAQPVRLALLQVVLRRRWRPARTQEYHFMPDDAGRRAQRASLDRLFRGPLLHLEPVDFAAILTAAEPLLATAQQFARWEQQGNVGFTGGQLCTAMMEEWKTLRGILATAGLDGYKRTWHYDDKRKYVVAHALVELVEDAAVNGPERPNAPGHRAFADRLTVVVELLRSLPATAALVAPAGGSAEGGTRYRFERVGKIFFLQFEDDRAEVPARWKGLSYIARLLQKPNANIPAMRIEGHASSEIGKEHRHEAKFTLGTGKSKPMNANSREGLAAIAARLEKIDARKSVLKEELQDPSNYELRAEYERLDRECTELLECLSKTRGLRGKARRLDRDDPAMKAAERVRKCIHRVRTRLITDHEIRMPKLARHLQLLKKYGVTFVYRPADPAPDWIAAP